MLDFKLLKQVMRPVIEYLDHQMMNDLPPFTEINPSAENLAKYFYDETNKQLHEMTSGRVQREGLHHLRDRHHDRHLLRVDAEVFLIEIYKSVQGESSFAGLPCIFVRLAGCNLRCSWCDSEYTFSGGYKLSEDQVVAEIEKLAPVKLIEFTGGEPMLQEKELLPLMDRLLRDGYTLMIETSGERPLADVPKAVHKIVDVKCPGSGEGGSFHLEQSRRSHRARRSEVRAHRSSRLRIRSRLHRQHSLAQKAGSVLLVACVQQVSRAASAPQTIACWTRGSSWNGCWRMA